MQAALIAHGGGDTLWAARNALSRRGALLGSLALLISRRYWDHCRTETKNSSWASRSRAIEAVAARRADRRHVGGRDARRSDCSSGSSPTALTCCSPSTTWMSCSDLHKIACCSGRADRRRRRQKCADRSAPRHLGGGREHPRVRDLHAATASRVRTALARVGQANAFACWPQRHGQDHPMRAIMGLTAEARARRVEGYDIAGCRRSASRAPASASCRRIGDSPKPRYARISMRRGRRPARR